MLLRYLLNSEVKSYYEQNVILFIPCPTILTLSMLLVKSI